MKIHIAKSCATCEFNFRGICAGDKCNEKIYDVNSSCEGWSSNLYYFDYLIENAPWYLKQKYKNHKISFDELVDLLEKDENDVPINLNIFDVIENIYDLKYPYEIAKVLGVSDSVVSYAYYRGTPTKRLHDFSNILCIPTRYFHNITTCDFNVIETCKEEFYKHHKHPSKRKRKPVK